VHAIRHGVRLTTAEEQRQYLLRIQKEHRRIYEAIRDGQPAEARKAMRGHLTGSLKRYRRLAERQLVRAREAR
jgi:DNA-binding FadR family transcriptional regulator